MEIVLAVLAFFHVVLLLLLILTTFIGDLCFRSLSICRPSCSLHLRCSIRSIFSDSGIYGSCIVFLIVCSFGLLLP